MSEGIKAFMRVLLDDYRHLRGKPKDNGKKPFWDLVVLTTVDSAQKEAFLLQIEEKRERGELPTDLPIHLVCDPPGVRIGNGGSTLVAIETLHIKYGSKLFDKKVLLVHAGGWSQRMPSCTVLGKAFFPLPRTDPNLNLDEKGDNKSPPWQMLDLKLALYWPFVERMKPGVFLACADDFILYDLGDNSDWKIPEHGFTALAHPSPIATGRGHGVYVLADDVDTQEKVVVSECLQVLQKPNDERMRAKGAVLKGDQHTFADGISVEGEAVYSDSSFYFGMDVVRKMIDFKKSAGELGCEIDAYGDFLQAVGKNASNEYITLVGNISQMTPNLLKMRQGVFDCLNSADIHVLVMNASLFKHIGTTKELLYHFCQDSVFQAQLGFEKDVFNTWSQEKSSNGSSTCVEQSESACVMHSAFHPKTFIAGPNVIDFCDFDLPVDICSNSIISNCQFKQHLFPEVDKVVFPYDMFYHTVPVSLESCKKGGLAFLTVFFNINDNLKKCVPKDSVESLPYLYADVGHFLKSRGYTKEDVLPVNQDKVSLWTLRLFPSHETMSQSLSEALRLTWPGPPELKVQKSSPVLYSIADLINIKDVKSMLTFRRELFDKIRRTDVTL